MKSYRVIVIGRVQHVGFRYHVKEMAKLTGIKGFVKNMPDGSVLIEMEAEDVNLNTFTNLCKKGNAYSVVNDWLTQEQPLQNFTDFSILIR